MLQPLKPTDAAIEKLALAETDLTQRARFAPIRAGFLGNAAVILFAGAAGVVHAALAAAGRRLFGSSRDDAR